MPISTYPDVRTAIWDLLDITSSAMSTAKTDVLVASSEYKLYRDLRVRQMETALSSTITSSGTVALPSDYIELKNAYLDTSPTTPLQRKSAEWIYQMYPTRSADGKPKFIAREGANFIFGPYPDSSTYLLKGIYYFKPTAVAGTSSTLTGILSDAPYLLVFQGAADVEKALGREERAAMWEMAYRDLKEQIRLADYHEAFSGSVPHVTNA